MQQRWMDWTSLHGSLDRRELHLARILRNRDGGRYHRPRTIGFDLHRAMKATQALADSADPDPGTLRVNFRQTLRGDALALVPDFDSNANLVPLDSNAGSFALCVTVDVCQAFLYDAKNRKLHLGREPSKIFGDVQFNRDAAAFRNPLYVPVQRWLDSRFI